MEQEQKLREMAVFFERSAAELRTHLSTAMAAADQLGDGGELLGSLRLSLHRMLRLAWNLNDFSLAAAEAPLHLVNTGAAELVQSVYDESAVLLADIGRTLRLETGENLSGVAMHPYAARRILYQLLSNAAAVTPQGGTIRLACRRTAAQVLFSVSDEGGGIDPNTLDGIFTAPFAAEDDFSPHGLRIGLPLAKLLAEKQGGRLLAESSEKGCCFTLALPTGQKADSLRDMKADYSGGVCRPLVELSPVLTRKTFSDGE